MIPPPLPIKGSIYDSALLRGPKLMAILRMAGHMEPVDRVGFQRWNAYLTAWFSAYLDGDLQASTLIWGVSSPQSLQVNPQMSSLYSFPGMSVGAERKEAEADQEAAGEPDLVLSGSVENLLDQSTKYGVWYFCGEDVGTLEVKPDTPPILTKFQSAKFAVEATFNETVGAARLYVICNSGGTLATAEATWRKAVALRTRLKQ